jgi:site-specific DNA-cytosine methylase
VNKIKIFEMFAGYGTASFALKQLGVDTEIVAFSEIDKYAIECFKQNHGMDLVNLGDATKIDVNNVPDHDLLTGGFPCCLAGTLITTERGQIPIEDVKVGDTVLTHKNRWRKVTHIMNHMRNHHYVVKFQGSPELKITGNHRVYCKKMIKVWDNKVRKSNRTFSQTEWISIDEIRNDDFIGFGCHIRYDDKIHKQDNSVWIDKNLWGRFIYKERIEGKVKTYNLTVEEDHSYVANNVIVKNCQAFSVAGKGQGELDPRGTLVWDIIRIAQHKQPKMMLLENVKGFTFKKFKPTFDKLLSELDRIGYDVFWEVLNTKDYGIPQSRARIWFVCFRKDLEVKDFKFPEKEELKIFIKDILEDEVDEKYYLSEKMQERFRKYLEEKNEKLGEKESTILDVYNKKIKTDGCSICLSDPCHNNLRLIEGEREKDNPLYISSMQKHNTINKKGISNCLPSAMGEGGGHTPMVEDNPKVINPLKNKTDYGWHFEQAVYDVDGLRRSLKSGSGSGNIPKIIERSKCTCNSGGECEVCCVGCGNYLDSCECEKEEKTKIYDNHRKEEIREYEDVSYTLSQAMGTGGNNVPIIKPKTEINRIQLDSSGKGHVSQNDRVYDINHVMGCLPNANPSNKVTINDDRMISNCLDANQHKGVTPEMYYEKSKRNIVGSGKLRRLTPIECFRLQGFLNNEVKFDGLSDTQRYKLAGNGQSVNVVRKIFREMFKHIK